MTPDKAHQCLNCDSCGHAEKTNSEEYPFKCLISKPVSMMVHRYCVSWFGYVGCASHTSADPAQERIDAAIKELERLAAEKDQLKKESKTNEPWMGHAYAASAYMKAIALLQAGRK